MKSVNVLQLIDTLQIGGAENIVFQQSTRLRNEGVNSIVCSWKRGGPYKDILESEGIKVISLESKRRSIVLFPLFLLDVLMIFKRIIKIIKQHDIQIINSHLVDSAYIGSLVGRLTGIKIVHTFQNNNFLPNNRHDISVRHYLRLMGIRFAVKASHQIIVVGESVKKCLKDLTGCNSEKIKVVFNSIDTEKFNNATNRLKPVKKNPKKRTIVCVARLVPQKGQKDLLLATPEVLKKHPDIQILLVGDGPQKKELENLIQELNISTNVRLMGVCLNVSEILKEADVFVLPSYYEGTPLSLMEAMASYIPVVATAIPGTMEVVEHGISGLLVPPGRPDLLSENILKILDDDDLAKHLSVKGREKIERKFNIQTNVKNVYEIYYNLLYSKT